MSKVYIVTGATGFVGNNLVKELEKNKETVVAFARSEEKVKKALAGSKAKVIYGDVTKMEDLEKAFEAAGKKNEIVLVHTASVVNIGKNRKQLKHMKMVNAEGAKNAIEICLKYKCRLLYVSSVHAITELPGFACMTEITDFDPKSVVGKYAKSKAESSRLVMEAIKTRGLDAVLVHPAGITGPNDYSDTHMRQVVEDYNKGRIPAATNGGYDFVDVRDVAAGIVAAIEKGKPGDCYLLTNEYYTVSQMLKTLYELGAGKKIKMKMPIWLARVSLPFLSIYFKIFRKRPLYTPYSLYTLKSNSNFSHAKASKELGYFPRSLKESLSDTLEFLKTEGIIK